MAASGGSEIVWEPVDGIVDRRIDESRQHVWPFSGSFPIDVRFVVLDRPGEVPKHRPDHLEVVFFESGEAGYEVEDQGFLLHQHDLVVVGDQKLHRTLPVSASAREARIAVMSFLPRLLYAGDPRAEDLQYLMPFSSAGAAAPSVIQGEKGLATEVFDLMQKVRRELPADTERSTLAVRTYLRMILFLLADHCWDRQETRDGMRQRQANLTRLAPVFEDLSRGHNWALTIREASRRCAMSPSCFMQLFREVTGQSFVGYKNRARVERAKELLRTTDLELAEIGHETGFCDQSYFGSVFRGFEGLTPQAFRKSLRAPW